MDPVTIIHPSDQDLVAYLHDQLDAAAAEQVRLHLETCDACRKRSAEASGGNTASKSHSHTAEPGTTRTEAPAKNAAPAATMAVPPELAAYADYEIVRELGSGGMGVVYLARNRLMDRLEVLKVLNKSLLDKPGAVERFLREIRSAARLSHSNVVGAFRAVQLGDLLVFAMEYVDGRDLSQLVREQGPLPASNACYYTYQAAVGLQHAQEKGMVHRDIKPSNLMLARDGKKHVVKILDFGLAKASSERPLDGGLTGEGQILGTPDYIAPEQTLNAVSADIRADIYSLGCSLYFLISGKPPFRGKSLFELLQAHQTKDPTPLPNLPEGLWEIISRMMAKDIARRYQTPGEVALALAPFFKRGVKPTAAEQPVLLSPAAEPAAAATWGSFGDFSASDSRQASKPTSQVKGTNKRTNESGSSKRLFWIGMGSLALVLVLAGLWGAGVFKKSAASDPVIAKAVEEPVRTRVEPPAAKVATAPAPKGKAETPPRNEDAGPPTSGLLPGFTALFNGKDLAGWKTSPQQPGGWSIDKGMLVGSGSSPSHLYSQDDNYEDLHVRAEVKFNDDGVGGLMARAEFGPRWPTTNPQYPGGYRTAIGLLGPPDKTGSLLAGEATLKRVSDSPVSANQWFVLELIAQGGRVTVQVNGNQTAQIVDEQRKFRKGHVALQASGGNSKVQFRRIDVKRLEKSPDDPSNYSVGPKGAFPTLREALAAAPAGAQIRVEPGEYSENALGLSRDVEIVGMGPRDKVVIKVREGTAFTSTAKKSVLRKLTVQAAGGSVAEITQGECRFEDCDLAQTGGSDKSPGLLVVRGADTAVTLKDSSVHDAPGGGIVVNAGALVMENSTVLRTKNQGILLSDGAKAELRAVKVTDLGQNALSTGWKCTLKASDCEFLRCPQGFPALSVMGDANCKLVHCRISEGEGGGVLVAHGADVTLDDCAVVGNRKFGIEVLADDELCKKNGSRTTSSLMVSEGRIANNAGVGVRVKKGGAATVSGCNLQNNDGGAWDILPGQAVKKSGNKE